jgi:hypothetical protein
MKRPLRNSRFCALVASASASAGAMIDFSYQNIKSNKIITTASPKAHPSFWPALG